MVKKLFVTSSACLLMASLASAETIVPAGEVYGTWYASGSPYLIQGEITIPDGSLLNVQPGVEVIFQGHYKFIVKGGLDAQGTLQDSILFTAANPTTGWHGLRFDHADVTCSLSYCKIEYGHASGTGDNRYGGGIYSVNSDLVVSHCDLSNNYAIWGGAVYCAQASNLQLTNSILRDNTADPAG